MVVYTITELDELQDWSKEKKIMILDFYAGWCGPCKRLSPLFEEYSQLEKYQDLLFLKVDIELAQDLTHHFSIASLPTIIILDATLQEIHKIVGFQKDTIERTLGTLSQEKYKTENENDQD